MNAKEIMTRDIITVSPSMKIKDLAMTLIKNQISGAPVANKDGKILGVVSEADIISKKGKEVQVRPAGPLRANNADALAPALIAGLGLAVQPDFVVGDAVARGRLEVVMPEWSAPPIALHLVMPPGGPRPARVEAIAEFLAQRLG